MQTEGFVALTPQEVTSAKGPIVTNAPSCFHKALGSTKVWKGSQHGSARIANCCGLMHFFCLQFARKPGDVGRLIVLNINSCKAWGDFALLWYSPFQSSDITNPLEECARSAAERGISLSAAYFIKQASKYEELNAKKSRSLPLFSTEFCPL